MLSWYTIGIVFGIVCNTFIFVVIISLVWKAKKLAKQLEDRWKNVKISSGRRSNKNGQLREVRIPGGKTMLQLQIGGTISSTSSVHPTRETWLNIQDSMSTNDNHTVRTTMGDLQEMFSAARQSQEGTSSRTNAASGIYVTNVTIEKPSDSTA
ncbi:uncharacterized protein LOC114524633 [Dendronephthya gigantea]|uniref:uncharacterized protein LOC114524633 n=1 Tax=Dendronephthya gigantea TaxID=151771 RepID=UPI00106A7264|nr:uncharacterized protein LOC114524633 [Dendronephthya gigantea]